MRADLEHDLGMPGERHRRRRAPPWPAVDEHGHLASPLRGERGQPGPRERLAPGGEQGPEREPGTRAHEHRPGRVQRHEVAVATRGRDPAVQRGPRRAGADPRGQQQDAVSGEYLHVHAVARPERRRAHEPLTGPLTGGWKRGPGPIGRAWLSSAGGIAGLATRPLACPDGPHPATAATAMPSAAARAQKRAARMAPGPAAATATAVPRIAHHLRSLLPGQRGKFSRELLRPRAPLLLHDVVVGLSRVLLALVLALAALGVLAPAARADGDPGSDVLVFQNLFVAADAGISVPQQVELGNLLTAAGKDGFQVQVAIIATPSDLGAITALWKNPASYARFLGVELSLAYTQRLLVVMPNGLGFNWQGHPTAAAYRVLGKLHVGSGGTGLVTAAETAVRALAAASGVRIAVPPPGSEPPVNALPGSGTGGEPVGEPACRQRETGAGEQFPRPRHQAARCRSIAAIAVGALAVAGLGGWLAWRSGFPVTAARRRPSGPACGRGSGRPPGRRHGAWPPPGTWLGRRVRGPGGRAGRRARHHRAFGRHGRGERGGEQRARAEP